MDFTLFLEKVKVKEADLHETKQYNEDAPDSGKNQLMLFEKGSQSGEGHAQQEECGGYTQNKE
jgi:hypothetical protein